MNPFEYLNSINTTKKDVMVDDVSEKAYNGFMINRSLSYFPDTVMVANEMNRFHQLDNKLQYDFLINIVRKRKRFSKWMKANDSRAIQIVKEYYGYSDEKAREVVGLLSSDELNNIEKRMYKGGKS